MKAIVEAKELNRAIRLAGKFCGQNAEVLWCVSIQAAGKSLTIEATNLDHHCNFVIPAEVSEPGTALLNHDQFKEIAKPLRGDVRLEAKNDTLELASGTSWLSMDRAKPKDGFPVMPAVKGESYTFDGPAFLEALRRLSYTLSNDENRVALTGIYLSIAGGVLTMASTDTHRLGVVTLPTDCADLPGVIIPWFVLDKIFDLTKGNDDIALRVDKTHARFIAGDGTILVTKTIEGPFPNFRKVVPTEFRTEIEVLRDNLAQSLAVLAPIAWHCSNRLVCDIGPDGLKMSATASGCAGTEETEIIMSGKPLRVAFNVRYLQDALRATAGDVVKVRLVNDTNATVFTNPDDDTYQHIVMPTQLE